MTTTIHIACIDWKCRSASSQGWYSWMYKHGLNLIIEQVKPAPPIVNAPAHVAMLEAWKCPMILRLLNCLGIHSNTLSRPRKLQMIILGPRLEIIFGMLKSFRSYYVRLCQTPTPCLQLSCQSPWILTGKGPQIKASWRCQIGFQWKARRYKRVASGVFVGTRWIVLE